MAVTNPSNVDTAIQELWAKLILRDFKRTGFWAPFIGGEGSGKPIIQRSELLAGGADTIHIQVTNPLSGAGVEGDVAVLEGNEENLATSEIRLTTTLYRHAVKNNRRAAKKSSVDLFEETRLRLAEWGADKLDSVRFTGIYNTSNTWVTPDTVYTPNTMYASATAGDNNIVAANKWTVALARKVKYKLLSQKAKPFKVNGLPWWAVLISPEQEYDLKQDTQYDNYAVQAQNRGMDNPIFTGALMAVDGLVFYPHFSVPTLTNANATPTRIARSLAFGAEFALEALDENVSWVERDFDYGHQKGVAYSFASKCRRGLEQNSIQVMTSAVVPS